MILILSPAKTLDLSPLTPVQSSYECTRPNCSSALTKDVAKVMKKHAGKGKSHMAKLLGVSANIAASACNYWSDYSLTIEDAKFAKPAIFSFMGAAYQGLNVNDGLCEDEEAMKYLQSNLRIIDPLYGSLRPLDEIQPYRLEMATKKIWEGEVLEKPKALAKFWEEAVTSSISDDLVKAIDNYDGDKPSQSVLVNLASEEYSAAVNKKLLPENCVYVKCIFRDGGRVIAVHAKKARGLMVRYLAQNNVQDVERIKKFNLDGYTFHEKESSINEFVFGREKQEKKNNTKAKRRKKSN